MRLHVRLVGSMATLLFNAICLPWHYSSSVIVKTAAMPRRYVRTKIAGWTVTKKYLPRDDRSPRLILANYCAEMNFTEDQVDRELDWEYLYAPPAEDRSDDE